MTSNPGATTTMAAASPRRIAIMLESDGPGGAESMVMQLAEELRRRGHWVLPVGPDNGCGWLAEQFRRRGFPTATFSLRRPVDFTCLRGIVSMLREHRIDLVNGHEFTCAVYGAAAARQVGVDHVATMHGSQYVLSRWRRRAALRWAFRRSRGVISVSNATTDHMVTKLGVPAPLVRTVPNGIAFTPGDRRRIRTELGLADDGLLVIAVGNLVPRKGHAYLLRAMAQLPEAVRGLPWAVAIAGRGDEEAPLRALAAELGIADRVHLLGHRDDIADLLAASDIFTMPSLWEGLPVAMLEAMFCEKPVVASAVSGIPEAIASGTDGLLVPAEDPAALAAALAELLGSPARRAELGAAGRARAQRQFSVSTMVDAYEDAFGFHAGPAR